MSAIGDIYRRLPPIVYRVPAVAVLIFGAEFLQHAVVIRLGMYAPGALLDESATQTRLLFGIIKIGVLLAAIIFALRWWRYGGDTPRAARPTWRIFKGLALVLAVQLTGELLLVGLGTLVARAVGLPPAVGVGVPLLIWLLGAVVLYPWYVALLTEDRAMTLRRSIHGTAERWLGSVGIFVSGILPAMMFHYALGYGALGRPEPVVWLLLVLDSAVVAALGLLIASTYFCLYQRAKEATAAAH